MSNWVRNKGTQPVNNNVRVEVQFPGGGINSGIASSFYWGTEAGITTWRLEPKSDMEAILDMVKQESAIQDTMDQAALILSSGEHMNDKQEENLVHVGMEGTFAEIHTSTIQPSADYPYQEQLNAIRTETMRTKDERASRILAGYIQEIEELADDCDFELTVNLALLSRVQLVNLLDALRTLRMEQTK